MSAEPCEWCGEAPVSREKRERIAALFTKAGGAMSEKKDRDGKLFFFRHHGFLRLHGLCDSCDLADAEAFFR